MNAIYVNLYPYNAILSLPAGLITKGASIECLKGAAPDDGEANKQQSKYRIDCPDDATKELLRWLNETGKSLMYWVVKSGNEGEMEVIDAGELNAECVHYPTRLFNSKRLLELWFEDYFQTDLAA